MLRACPYFSIVAARTGFGYNACMTKAKICLKKAKAKRVWEIFRQINRVPRCSKNERQIIEWLKCFAQKRNLACRNDDAGNTVIELPATKGYEKSQAVVLQSHVDMVCEKTPESKHDFSKDPIELVERDGWVCAQGTTLGADNGAGVSLSLALADENIAHPRLELLFTVEEETGLTGANALQKGFITGKYLINLDGEDESFIVGCAGGEIAEITLKLDWTEPHAGLDYFTLNVSGLFGGHSGIDIDKQRANAIQLLTRTIRQLQNKYDLYLCEIDGGRASNAIPRDAQAIIYFKPSDLNSIKKSIAEMESSFKKEFPVETLLKVELTKAKPDANKSIINNQLTIINLLSALPAGVYRMSAEFPGVVETSNNLARVETLRDKNLLRITMMQRGFEPSSMSDLTGKISAIAHLAGAEVEVTDRYPAWRPDNNSSLLALAKKVYKRLHKTQPQIIVVHAGLEPAVIGRMFENIEMISVGPTIENPHSPRERLNIASVDAAWKFLIELIPVLK